MKKLGKFLAQHYTRVNSSDNNKENCNNNNNNNNKQQQQQPQNIMLNKPIATNSNERFNVKTRKSLTANRSVSYSNVLDSFFNARQHNQRARSPKCSFLLLAVGILIICVGVLFKVLQPYDLIFKYKLTFQQNGEIFNLWEKPPVDLYIKVYLFNITNAEAFLAGREKMNVEQVGPYVYKELMTHENVTFNSNKTISSTPSHPLVWQEHLSEGNKEDDEVVMLNIAMLAIADLTANRNIIVRLSLSSLFSTLKTAPIVRMTAKEFMFGYATQLTSLGNTFMPNWIHFDKVGLIDRMYDFSNEYETFYTGDGDPSISGLYATYMGKKNLPQWPEEHCSNIEMASDGSKFRSFLKANDTLKFFRKSMCRPIKLKKSNNELIQVGHLQGYKYNFEDNAFDNGHFNKANKCFCRKGYCQPMGLLDVTDCYYGFPISLSLPHFMDGDPALRTNVTGLKLLQEQHTSEFIIQPESGLPLSLTAKVQINMHFKNMRAFRQLNSFSHLTVPMLWFDVTMPQLPQRLDLLFNMYLNVLPYIEPVGFWLCLMVGCSLVVYTISRATIRMTGLTQLSPISENTKYGRSNLLHRSRNGVYMPCEMKSLKHDDEMVRIEENKKLRSSHLILDLEPALSASDSSQGSCSSDEGSESDTATLSISRNSSSSHCAEV